MKNNYLFKQLEKKELLLAPEKDDVFLSMLATVRTGDLLLSTTSFTDLLPFFEYETYYIAHNLVSYKGKKMILRGAVVKTLKNELIDFINKSINSGDMREFFISPIFTDSKKIVLYLAEDLYYLYES